MKGKNMKKKIGFIGCGGIAEFHMEALHQRENLQLAYFYDINPRAAGRCATKYDGVVCSTVGDMVASDDIAAIWICVPPYAHTEVELEVVRAGIPFFIEKPLGLNPGLVEQMNEEITRQKLLTCVGFHWRYKQSVQMAKTRLNGRIPHMFQAYWSCPFIDDVPWWGRKSQSGGQVMDQIIHLIDQARYLMGEVTEVYARAVYPGQDADEIERCAIINIYFDNQSIGTICSSNMGTNDNSPWIKLHLQDEIIHIGSRDLEFISSENTRERCGPFDNGMEEERQTFLEHLDQPGGSNKIRSPYQDAAKTMHVAFSVLKSITEGKAIQISRTE
jgi:myo-inositol 2-dehydrogenase / D-chiro-inositol 1-dehydrogenase